MQTVEVVIAGARIGKNHLDTLVNLDPVETGGGIIIPRVTGLARKDATKWSSFTDGLSERCCNYLQANGFVYSDDAIALLSNSPAAIAVIATPSSDHYALGMLALEHGKHVLIEKPLATTQEEGDALITLAREKSLMLDIGTQLRVEAPSIEQAVHLHQPTAIEIIYQLPERARNESVYLNIFPHISSMLGGSIVQESLKTDFSEKTCDVSFEIAYGENSVHAVARLAYVSGKPERKITLVAEQEKFSWEFLPGRVVEINGKGVYHEVRKGNGQEHMYRNPRAQLWENFLRGIFDSDCRETQYDYVAYMHNVLMKGNSS
ncbi:hypothetical protein C4573_01320 [Candidatus Woesearchaeota archaeon]|nr:MAG: hypothetical protein C4573_01320 [Candidatus Woesearchaeota archaeon]